MSIRTLAAIAAGGLVMILSGGRLSPLYAQENTSVDVDAEIVREVSTGNLLELRLTDMARKKSANASVKSFAERLRTDHLKMHEQLNGLVGQNGQPFRISLGKMEPQLAEVRRLEQMSGTQFDQEFVASMIRHHQDNLRYFETNANAARSSQVRTLLANNVPVLQQHLSLAVQLGNQVGPGQVATGGQNPLPPTQSPTPPSRYPAPPTQSPTPPTQYPAPQTQYPAPPAQNPPAAPVLNENTPASRAAFKKDGKFVREALQDNTLEIRVARAAQQKSTHSNVRQLAQRVQGDHAAMLSRWLSLAASNDMRQKKVNLGPKHTEKAKRLEKTSAAEFDRAYLTMLIQNNQDYVEYFQKEGKVTNSAQVRSQAANDLTTLRQHLAFAKQLGVQVGVDTTAALRARHTSAYRNQ